MIQGAESSEPLSGCLHFSFCALFIGFMLYKKFIVTEKLEVYGLICASPLKK